MILNDNERSWFGFQVGYQPENFIFLHQDCPPAIGFQKLHQPPQCLIWAINHKFALRFSSVRSRATDVFKSNLTTWAKIFWAILHGLLWAYALRQALSSDNLERMSHSWKDFSTMNRQDYRRWGKQFITIEPTRIHTKYGRSHNGNLRYTIRPIEDAIHYFHERQGLRH